MRGRSLVWFRNDLRVDDNPALQAACERGDVVGAYMPAPAQWRSHGMGANRTAFLLRTLHALAGSLAALNIPLLIRTCDDFADHPRQLVQLATDVAADAVFCNDEYPLDERNRDAAASARCRSAGIEFHRAAGGVVLPPGRVLTAAGQPYTVFTPFKRRWLTQLDAGALELSQRPRPQRKLGIASDVVPEHFGGVGTDLLATTWPGGERAAQQRLAEFVAGAIHRYHEDRDRPDRDGTSCLSPYLAVGAISARQCVVAARSASFAADAGVGAWLNELIWRDFYAHVTAAFPDICRGRAFRPANDRVAWRHDPVAFDAWRAGRTGYPLVDAAMRQLAATGWMHNRLRMLTAMFLTKHLLLDWRHGERHFMELLVDGDFAANNGGWQWSASTGTDAAPYFRIFNPVTQAKKFDPDGVFVRRWVPELASLRGNSIFEPWRSGVATHYPAPIVEHGMARLRALAAFRA
jgi:deoxyribodipyrimidine photo-lyase